MWQDIYLLSALKLTDAQKECYSPIIIYKQKDNLTYKHEVLRSDHILHFHKLGKSIGSAKYEKQI